MIVTIRIKIRAWFALRVPKVLKVLRVREVLLVLKVLRVREALPVRKVRSVREVLQDLKVKEVKQDYPVRRVLPERRGRKDPLAHKVRRVT